MAQLIDSYGRAIEYLRLSVTDHCNLGCFYCMPEDGCGQRRASRLNNEEFTRLVRLFAELGVRKVRLTGGEPLLNRDLADLAQAIATLPGVDDLSLSTNAMLLARNATTLRRAGVTRLNISLDSLDAEIFAHITRGGSLEEVLTGIESARSAGFSPIKINMVVLKGINDHEIEAMAQFCCENGLELRYIETMPVGQQGQMSMAHYYPAEQILARLRCHFGTALTPLATIHHGPARLYQTGHNGSSRIGVITAMSQHFCATCNRLRLTATGDLVLCLGQQSAISLRDPLRAGAHDEELKRLIQQAVWRKPERHSFTSEVSPVHLLRPMYATGG